MAKNNTITLYDLQLASGCTISPFVWATKYALKHKGFEIDIVPGGFTGIMERTGGRSERLPVIVDDGKWVLDSWLIAEYLDEKYPDRPALFSGESMKVLTKFEPLRQLLRESKWLGGAQPNYADFRALAVFLWTGSIATTPPLTEDDPLRDWLDRGFDLYGGLGRHAGMHTLFGLKLRPGDPEPFVKGAPQGGLASRNTGPQSTRAETERLTR
jgi:glutathione S-transferase